MEFRVWLEGAEEDRGVSRLALRVWDRIVKSFGGLVLRPETLEVGVPPREVSGWSFDLGVLFPEFGGLRVVWAVRRALQAEVSEPPVRLLQA